jgi:uncharacterized membrane protein
LSVIIVFMVPADQMPLAYVRYFFSLVFVLYIPGYGLIKALFPVRVPIETHSVMLDTIERAIISLALSLAISPIIGLVLYYTPWGLGFVQITLGIFLISIVLLTWAFFRDHAVRKSQFLRRIIYIENYKISKESLIFLREKNSYEKRSIIMSMPLAEISSATTTENELTLTWNGETYVFFITKNSEIFTELIEKLRSISNNA